MLEIKYVALDTLKSFPRNPKQHALADLDESFSRFGFLNPVVVWAERSTIVAGHGRQEALIERRARWRDVDAWRKRYTERNGRSSAT